MSRHILHIVLMLTLALPALAQPEILTAISEEGLHLRWQGYRAGDFDGYHVYRRGTGQSEWEQLTRRPIEPEWRRNRIEDIAGYKTDFFFTLFGLGASANTIEPEQRDSVFTSPEARPFFEVQALINPVLGEVLGEIYVDETAEPGEYDYRITWVRGNEEADWATVRNVPCCQPTTLTEIEFAGANGRNARVDLHWQKQNGALQSGTVVTYRVYRATSPLGPFELQTHYGLLPATVSSGRFSSGADTMSFTDRFVTNGATYYYYIVPVNAFGQEGAPTPLIEVTPQSKTPEPPTQLIFRFMGDQIRVSWDAVPGALGYQVFRRVDDLEFEALGAARYGMWQNGTVHTETVAAESKKLEYYVRTVNAQEVVGLPSDTLVIYLPDATPPTPPTGLTATTERGRIILNWEANPEDDLDGYKIYRTSDTAFASGILLNAALVRATTFTDALREDATTVFGYYITAEDITGNESDPSEMVRVQLPDYNPPQAPLITGIEPEGPRVTVRWTSAQEPDLAYFTLERSADNQQFDPRGNTSLLVYTDSLDQGGIFWYRLTATDSTGNTSLPSPAVSARYDPNAQPLPPRTGALIDTNGSLLITWEPPANGNVAGYLIVKKDLNTGRAYDAAEPGADNRSFLDRYAKMDHTIVYRIYTRDARWRMSEPLILTYTPEND